MPFDKELILLNGTIALLTTTDIPPVELAVNGATGFAVVELKKTGVKGMAAVMTIPAEATAYLNTLTAMIQASNELDRNYVAVGDFPVLHTYIREMELVCTQAFVPADIGAAIDGDGAGTDSGILLSYDSALEDVNGVGNIVVQMDDAGDVFDQLAETLTVTGGATGIGTKAVAAVAPIQHTPGIYVVRFATDKRYVRCHLTVAATGFGLVQVNLSPYPFVTL